MKSKSQCKTHSPRSLASGRVENQRCCFWARGTLSRRHLDPVSRRWRRYFRNAWGEWADLQSQVIVVQGVWPFCRLQHPTPKFQGEHQCTELGLRRIFFRIISCSFPHICVNCASLEINWKNCFSELFPGLIHLCECAPRRWEPEQRASPLCEAREQDILLEVKSFGCDGTEIWGNILRTIFQVCQHSTWLWSWTGKQHLWRILLLFHTIESSSVTKHQMVTPFQHRSS